jgi:hypothetical protein
VEGRVLLCKKRASRRNNIYAFIMGGRIVRIGVEQAESIEYFLQRIVCGEKTEAHTPRSWLNKFGALVDDKFFFAWTKEVSFLTEMFTGLESHEAHPGALGELRNITHFALYIHYDTEKDFGAQFHANMTFLKGALKAEAAKAEARYYV